MKKRVIIAKVLVVMIFLFAIVSRHRYDENTLMNLLIETSGYLALMAAALGRLWASGFISGKKNQTLVTDGPYSIVRNPLYFFSFLGFVGAGLVFGSIVLALAMALVFFITHWVTILEEEKRLRRIFGERFEAYAKSVPRFIPNPWKMAYPPEVSIKPSAFTQAVVESSLITLIFVFGRVVESAQQNSILPVLYHIY